MAVVFATLPIEQRIILADALTATGKISAIDMVLIATAPSKEPPAAAAAIDWLQEPSRVGGRRSVVLMAVTRPRGRMPLVSLWNVYLRLDLK